MYRTGAGAKVEKHGAQGGEGVLKDKVMTGSGGKTSQDKSACQTPTDKKPDIILWAQDSFPPATFLWGFWT